jgi:hypothetical protein
MRFRPAITDFLYGDKNGQSLHHAFGHLAYLDQLAGFSAEQWANLIKTYLIER